MPYTIVNTKIDEIQKAIYIMFDIQSMYIYIILCIL